MKAEYIAKITGDTSGLEKAIQKANGTMKKLENDEVLIKLNYDGNIKEFNKVFDRIAKENPEITIQFQYDVNQKLLQKKMNELEDIKALKLDIDNKTVGDKINSLVKSIEDGFNSAEDSEDQLLKKVRELYKYINTANGLGIDVSTKDIAILDKLNERYESIYNFTSSNRAKKIQLFNIDKNIDKTLENAQKEINDIQEAIKGLVSKGASARGNGTGSGNSEIDALREEIKIVKSDIEDLQDTMTNLSGEGFKNVSDQVSDLRGELDKLLIQMSNVNPSFDGLKDFFGEALKLNKMGGLSQSGTTKYFQQLSENMDSIDEKTKKTLSNLGLLNKEGNITAISNGASNFGGIVGTDTTAIMRRQSDERNIDYYKNLKNALDEATRAGVNCSRILDVIDNGNGTLTEFQKTVTGSAISTFGEIEEGINPAIFKATDDQINKLYTDMKKLFDLGLEVDVENLTNILYDETKGFQIIDIDYGKKQFSDFEDMFNTFISTLKLQKEDIDEVLNDSATSVNWNNFVSRMENAGNQMGEAGVQGFRNGIDAHSNSKEAERAIDDFANGVVDEFGNRTGDMANAAQSAAQAIIEGFREEIKNGIDDINNVLDPEGIISKYLLGDNNTVKSREILESELNSEIKRITSEVFNKNNNASTEDYMDALEESFRKWVVHDSQYGSYNLDFNGARGIYEKWNEKYNKIDDSWLNKKASLSDDAYIIYGRIIEAQEKIGIIQRDNGEKYVNYMTRAKELADELYDAEKRTADFKQTDFSNLDITQEEANEKAKALYEESEALEKLVNTVIEFNNTNKEFDIFSDSPLNLSYLKTDKLKEISTLMSNDADKYMHLNTYRQARENTIFYDAIDYKFLGDVPKEIERIYDQLSNSVNEGSMSGKQAIESFDQQVKELGYTFNETAEKWEQITKVDEGSISYVKSLASQLKTIGEIKDSLTDPALSKDYDFFSQTLEDILKQYPELKELKDTVNSFTEAKDFINTDKWNDFLATLPQAKAYLESIGYDFEKLNQPIENNNLDSTQVSEEAEKLNVLIEKIESVKKAIEEKTAAFENEANTVDGVVGRETTALQGLWDVLDGVEQKINTAITKLDNAGKTDIVFSPKLVDDFDEIIQGLVESKTYNIKLTPKLTEDFTKKIQTLVNKVVKVTVDVDSADDPRKYFSKESGAFNNLTDEEIKLNEESQKWVDTFFGGMIKSKSVLDNLTASVKEMLETIKLGGTIDISELFNIASEDTSSIKKFAAAEIEEFEKVRKYVRNAKLQVNDSIKAEFGDDWTDIRNKFGVGVLTTKSDGMDIEKFYSEMQSALGHPLEDAQNAVDAIRNIYEYLSNPPDAKQSFISSMVQDIDSYEQELKNLANSLNINVSDDNFIAKSARELDVRNQQYAQQLQQAKENYEKEQEIFDQIQSTENFKVEEETVKNIVGNESEALKELIGVIDLVTNAINEKTLAFEKEGQVVDGVVQGEVTSLETLLGNINFIRQDVEGLQKDFENINVNVTVKGDSNELGDYLQSFSRVKPKVITAKIDKIKDSLSEFVKDVNNFKINDNTILSSINGLLAKSKDLENLAIALKASTEDIESAKQKVNTPQNTSTDRIKEATALYNQFYEAQKKQANIKSGTRVEEYKQLTQEMTKALQRVKDLKLSEEELAQVEKATAQKRQEANNAVTESQRKLSEANKKSIEQAESLKASVSKLASSLMSDGKLMSTYGDKVKSVVGEMKNINTSFKPDEAISKLKSLRNELVLIQSTAKETGKSGQTLGQMLSQRFKSLISYLGTFVQFYDFVRYTRTAISTLKDLDTQLVDLRKTTTMTTTELNEFYYASSDVAKQLGVTTSEIISQAAAWSRFNKIDPLYGNI